MQRRLRRILTAVRENCFVSYAKIITIGGFCDIDLIIIKATPPNDLPLPEKYVQELLKIFAFSPSSFRAFSLSFSRRFGNTRCWRVGLKCLVLLHRLLQSVPENSEFRFEILRGRADGIMSLHQCHFRDDSSSDSEDYSDFIRSYAQLLDETLNCDSFMTRDDSGEEINGIETLAIKISEINRLLELLPQLQSLIDRVIDCSPTGKSAGSVLIRSAIKHIVRESFRCYQTFCKNIIPIRENLLQLPYRSCIAAIGIYKKASIQLNQLSAFYRWCNVIGICGMYEHPIVDLTPETEIRTLETIIGRMWQLTESSSTSISSESSPPSANDEPINKVEEVKNEVIFSTEWEVFEENEITKEKPLMELEEIHENSWEWDWEDLLEASISLTCSSMDYDFKNDSFWGEIEDGSKAWKIQMYNPKFVNPSFHHTCLLPLPNA